jgi:hypothetical protein
MLAKVPGLVHAFTTRPHDVSMRLAGDAAARQAHREAVATDLGLDAGRLAACVQVHEPGIARIEANHPGGRVESTDGLFTAAPGLPLMAFSADCPLVLVCDPVRRSVGMVHASWRCTVARAVGELIAAMRRELGCNPAEMLAGVGPSAGPCCYEVKQDVYTAAEPLPNRDALFVRREGRTFFDLWAANRQQLTATGVDADNIEVAGICTMCRNDLFYSFRREGAGCGHFGLIAGWSGSAGDD